MAAGKDNQNNPNNQNNRNNNHNVQNINETVMPEEDTTSPNHPLYLHPNDHPGLILILKKLTGSDNYSTWKRSMIIALNARNKTNGVGIRGKELNEHYSQLDRHRIYQISNDIVQLKQQNCDVEDKWCGDQRKREEENQREGIMPKNLGPHVALSSYSAQSSSRTSNYYQRTSCNNGNRQERKSTFRPGVIYSNCNKECHSRDACYKLIGYPVGHPLHGKYKPPVVKNISVPKLVNSVTRQNQDPNTLSTSGSNNANEAVFTLNKRIAHGTLCDGLYIIFPVQPTTTTSSAKALNLNSTNTTLWHSKLGHPSISVMKQLKCISSDVNSKMVTDRVTLAIAIHNNWYIAQLDVNNAFLHGDLTEEVYMTIPQGYHTPHPKNSVCKLQKSLYGLKQANRQCIKDLGPIHYYLGIEFLRNSSGLIMSQRKYALKLIQSAGLLNVKPSNISFNPLAKLRPKDGDLIEDPSTYRSIIEKLLYLIITI
nr:retrovirus-related Pol polyprotein from transposon TNT 1-94 [Tanacetum cinerariifolium]